MSTPGTHDREVAVSTHEGGLLAYLAVPADARGLAVFAHGTGSDRHSGRNHHVAGELRQAALATLVMDLLTQDEQAAGRPVAPAALAGRVADAIAWASAQDETGGLPLGLFGSSTGAGVALLAAADVPDRVHAVVSRGGRTDLAADRLAAVHCPTRLVVGERDSAVLALNREALDGLGGEADLQVVPGASHLFEEPGALDTVAQLTREWFETHVAAR
jgi:pimeloyl-ACP methyl ester carboxylesterase